MTTKRRAVLVLAAVALCAAACSGAKTARSSKSATTTTATSSTTTTAVPAPGSVPRTDAAGTVWLCRPGIADDPCDQSLDYTSVSASGDKTVKTVSASPSQDADCFYVYPTVSTEDRANANLKVQPAETGAAIEQAARFSQACEVWAPMYRQETAKTIVGGVGSAPDAEKVAYDSLLSGFEDYLKHYNDGRPIMFIGHSQGAAIVIQLLRNVVEKSPSLRDRLLGAIILGGNVDVPTGKLVGGSFSDIPLCSSGDESGCVIAYSSFPSEPPADALFGRPGQGVSTQWGETESKGLEVACVNPASLSHPDESVPLDTYFYGLSLTGVHTGWVEFPARYDARCESKGGASWLNVTPETSSSSDTRPQVTETLGPTWGLHLYDVNLALGDLVKDVARMKVAFFSRHSGN